MDVLIALVLLPPKSNCLSTLNPEIAKQWHPTKNGILTPYDFTASSGKKVWWKCPKGSDHEWQAVISSRNKEYRLSQFVPIRNSQNRTAWEQSMRN